jgi:hypothetical protein
MIYLIARPEFAEELAQIHQEVSAALPRAEADPRRAPLSIKHVSGGRGEGAT